MSKPSSLSAENEATIRAWWGKEKVLCIGLRLTPCASKNSVIGHAHRLGLPKLPGGAAAIRLYDRAVVKPPVCSPAATGDKRETKVSDVWTESMIISLRDLWAAGHPTAEIGRRLRISKSAIVGKAHRLGLPTRESPIIRDDPLHPSPVPPVPRYREEPTLAPLASVASVVPRTIFKPIGASRECSWPIGDPGTRGFRFCGDMAIGGKSYCVEHHKLAYIRVRDVREGVA